MSDNEDFIVNSSTTNGTQLQVESQMATLSHGTTMLYLERLLGMKHKSRLPNQ